MSPSPRTLTLLDAMALVAAIGAGLALDRYVSSFLGPSPPTDWPVFKALDEAMDATAWPSLALSLTLIAFRSRPPRPSRRRLARLPGFVACAAVATTLSLAALGKLLWLGSFLLIGGRVDAFPGYQLSVLSGFLVGACGPAVAAAWMVLLLGGRWRPEPGWIDRLGRLLGLYWIAYSATREAIHFLRFMPP